MSILSRFIEDHTAHSKQITALSECVDQLANISAQIEVETHPSISYLIQRVQIRHFLLAVNEFNAMISHAISAKNHSPAEALARTSIEMSVNLIFVLGGDRHARSKGLLLACIDARKSKAKKWGNFATSAGLTTSRASADLLLSETEALERGIVSSSNEPCEPWPKTSFDRFKLTGFEGSYRTCFQSSSDSVHLLGEDILNKTRCSFMPEKVKEAYFSAVAAEKGSFAIYLFIQAVLFQCEAIMSVICKTADYDEQAQEISRIATLVQSMHTQHEDDLKRHHNQAQG